MRARLDLEHLGAEKAQRLPGHRARPDPAEIDHPDALQGQCAGRLGFRARRVDCCAVRCGDLAQHLPGVLSEQRRRRARATGRDRQLEGRPQRAHGSQRGMGDVDEEVARGQVRLLRGLGHREHGRHRATRRLAFLHDFHLAVLHRPFLDERIDQVGVPGALEHVLEQFEIGPFRIAHDLAQPVPLPRLQRQHPDMAVLAGHDRRRRALRHAHARALVEDAVLGVATDVLSAHERGRDGLGRGHVQVLPAARLPPAVDRCQSPGCRRDCAEIIRRKGAVLERRFIRAPAVAAARTGEVVRVEVVAVPVAVGTGLAERCDRDHDEVRVRGGQRGVIEPPCAHLRRRVVLDQQIRPRHETQEHRPPRLGAHVAADAALVGVVDEVEPALLGIRHIARKRPGRARGIARGQFDLDHVSTVVGEQFRAERRGDHLPEIDDLDARQRSGAHVPTSRIGGSRPLSTAIRRARAARTLTPRTGRRWCGPFRRAPRRRSGPRDDANPTSSSAAAWRGGRRAGCRTPV